VRCYEVRWAALAPTEGAEVAKTRPVVIVSLDVLNEHLRTVTVCPLTSTLHPEWRTRVPVRIAQRDAEVAVDHIRSVSKARLGRKLGTLTESEARSLRRRITEMYGE
jgi:mRNA interferase MazF